MIVGIDIGTQSLKVAVTDRALQGARRGGNALPGAVPAAGLGGAGSRAVGTRARADDRPRAGRGRRHAGGRSRRSASAASSTAALPSMPTARRSTPCLDLDGSPGPGGDRGCAGRAHPDARRRRPRCRPYGGEDPLAEAARRARRRGRALSPAGVLSGGAPDGQGGDGSRAGLDHHGLCDRSARASIPRCSTASRSRPANCRRWPMPTAAPDRCRRRAPISRDCRAGIPVAVGTGDDFSTPLGAGLLDARPARRRARHRRGGRHGASAAGHRRRPASSKPTPIPAAPISWRIPAGCRAAPSPGCASCWAIDGFDALDAAAATAPPGADGRHLHSRARPAPWRRSGTPAARGCFYGLTPSHGAPHLARALLEGCAFAMRDVADRLAEMGAEIRSLLLLGGGARSRLWAQIRADIMGLPAARAAAASTPRRSAPPCWRPWRRGWSANLRAAAELVQRARGAAGAGDGQSRRL